MSNLITANVINGADVYGVRQMQYTVDGIAGQDYTAALIAASFRQATAIEESASSYMEVVRQRQSKVSDLGEILSVLAMAVASMDPDGPEPGDKSERSDSMDTYFRRVIDICDKYSISMNVQTQSSHYYMTRGDVMNAQNDIQYTMDMEDNNLQQDLVALQSFLAKRDNAFSTAAKLVKKSQNASAETIGNMGG
ncbi:MAG: hypothetical protein IJR99_08915 [Kiritimatiellae bacterium]|nr:hypothetical protein [Kiritimatiellia bacterium]